MSDFHMFIVSDVLVTKALEIVGKKVVRAERSRFKEIGNDPFYRAHTKWQIPDSEVSKSLRDAWTAVPSLFEKYGDGCTFTQEQLIETLDGYVHDLVITGTPHCPCELEYRFDHLIGESGEQTPRHLGQPDLELV